MDVIEAGLDGKEANLAAVDQVLDRLGVTAPKEPSVSVAVNLTARGEGSLGILDAGLYKEESDDEGGG